MANYTLNPIEANKYEVVSHQTGRHYLRLRFSDLNRSFAVGEAGRKEWFKSLDEAGAIDIGESNRYQIGTKTSSATELKKTVQTLLGYVAAENRKIEAENAKREAERQDLLLVISAVMGDIPRMEEE